MHTKEVPLISVARVIRALLVIMGRNASGATQALTKIGTDKEHAPLVLKIHFRHPLPSPSFLVPATRDTLV